MSVLVVAAGILCRWLCHRWGMLAVSLIGAGMALTAGWSGALALFPGAPMKVAVWVQRFPGSPAALMG